RTANSLDEVGLTHSATAIKKKRVVTARWIGRNRTGCGVRELIAGPDHERIERKSGVQSAGAGLDFRRIQNGDWLVDGAASWGRSVTDTANRQVEILNRGLNQAGVFGLEQ